MASNQLARQNSGVGFYRNLAQVASSDLAQRAGNAAWTGVKRKWNEYSKSKKKSQPSARNRSAGRRTTSAAQANTRVAERKNPSRKKQRSVSFRKVNRVKVSRVFRAKVNKALVPKRINAFCELRDTQYVRCELFQKQMLFYLGFESTAENSIVDGNCVNTTNTPWHFTPARVLDLASYAFNAKAAVSVSPSLSNEDMFLASTRNIKVHVKKSWVTHQIRNNTESPYYLKLFVVAPRKSSAALTNALIFDAWKESITAEINQEIIKSDPETTIRQMDLKPNQTAIMNQCYKFSETSITLEPGQCFDFNLPGPEDFTYDFSKYYEPNGGTDGTTYHELQKMCRTVIVTGVPDLKINYSQDGSANSVYCTRAGQAPFNSASGANVVAGICVEYRAFYDITMPEQAGFVYPATTGTQTQPLNHRQSVKVYKNFFDVNEQSLDARVDPEVPSSININPQ